jgi:hypothetical protein
VEGSDGRRGEGWGGDRRTWRGRARGGRQVGSRLRGVGGDRRVHAKGREISARGKPECLGWCEATETDSTVRDVLRAGIVPV